MQVGVAILLEEVLGHLRLHAKFGQPLGEVFPDVRILAGVVYGAAAFFDPVQVAGLHLLALFTEHDAPVSGGTTPVVDDAHWLRTDAEVLVEPVAPAGGRGY